MSGYDLSVLPDQPKQYDLSSLPDQPNAADLATAVSPYDEMNQPQDGEMEAAISAADQKAPVYKEPMPPANLLRENAPQIQQDVWNEANPQPAMGPLREKQLRPDLTYATGITQNLEAGLRTGFNHVLANLFSLARSSYEETGIGQEPPEREAIFRSTFEAMNKALQVDKLAPPQDFADALARGAGESGVPLAETMALSYLTAGVINPLTAGIAQKVPYLYSWLFPMARDAITIGAQSALEPGATAKSTELGAGTGAIMSLLGPYGRLNRAIGGAALGIGQEYMTNPQAQPMDYARNAALMGAFAVIGGAHGITADEAAAGTMLDWAKGKGYSDEKLARAIRAQGLGPIANEFAQDVTSRLPASEQENRSGMIVGTRPGEQIGTIEHPTQTIPDLNRIGNGVHQIISSEPVKQLARDLFGIDNLQIRPITGTWEGNPEPSFVLYGDNMSFEAAEGLSRLLGWAFNQDATVVTMPHSGIEEGTAAAYISSDYKLTPGQLDTILESARKKGLDFSTTIDGKGVKFLHFGDEAELRKFYNDAREIGLSAGLSDFADTIVRSNLNEAETYLKDSSESGGSEGGLQRSWAKSPDLFRRAVDNLLAPYIRLIEPEGFRFSVQKFADLFGHSKEEARLIEESVHPKSESGPPESE
jgi:hypothetical protein